MGALDDAIRRVEAEAATEAAEATEAARGRAQDVERLQQAVDDFLRRMHAAGDPGTEPVAVGPENVPRRLLRLRTGTRMRYVAGWKLCGRFGPALTVDGRWSEVLPGAKSALDGSSRVPVPPPERWRVSSDGYHPLRGGLRYDAADPHGRPPEGVTRDQLELALARLLVEHGAQ